MNLTAQGNDLGEFIFGYPDIAEVPYPPILDAVENYPGVQPYNVIAPPAATTGVVYSVNQTLPVWLSWSPKGFAGYTISRFRRIRTLAIPPWTFPTPPTPFM